MKTIRVDITSEPKLANDETLARIREAVADLADVSVTSAEEDVVIVAFNVQGNALGEALTKGEGELWQRLEAAGIKMRFLRGGATGWA